MRRVPADRAARLAREQRSTFLGAVEGRVFNAYPAPLSGAAEARARGGAPTTIVLPPAEPTTGVEDWVSAVDLGAGLVLAQWVDRTYPDGEALCGTYRIAADGSAARLDLVPTGSGVPVYGGDYDSIQAYLVRIEDNKALRWLGDSGSQIIDVDPDSGAMTFTAWTDPVVAGRDLPWMLEPHPYADGKILWHAHTQHPAVPFPDGAWSAFWVATVTGTTVSYGTRLDLTIYPRDSTTYDYINRTVALPGGRFAVFAEHHGASPFAGAGGTSKQELLILTVASDVPAVTGDGYYGCLNGSDGSVMTDGGGALVPAGSTCALWLHHSKTVPVGGSTTLLGEVADLIDVTTDPPTLLASHQVLPPLAGAADWRGVTLTGTTLTAPYSRYDDSYAVEVGVVEIELGGSDFTSTDTAGWPTGVVDWPITGAWSPAGTGVMQGFGIFTGNLLGNFVHTGGTTTVGSA